MLVMVFLVLLGSAAFVAFCGLPAAIRNRGEITPDAHAKQGTFYNSSAREVPRGEFRMMLNQLPTIEVGSRDCNIQYENPAENHYSVKLSLYLEETGERLGGTAQVAPGFYVDQIRLNQELPVGEHHITVQIELLEDNTPAGEMAAVITLRVIEPQKAQGGSQDEP